MDHRQFLKLFLPVEGSLKAYLLVATRDHVEAEELLQQVATILWEKFSQYDAARPFKAWALGVTRMTVLRWKEKRANNREMLSDDALALVAETATETDDEMESKRLSLQSCLKKVDGSARTALDLFYHKSLSIKQIAVSLGKSDAAIEMILVRIRRALRDCIVRMSQKIEGNA